MIVESSIVAEQYLHKLINKMKGMIESRVPKSQNDFGDEKTTLLCLKRKGVDIFEGDPNNKFGIFLGEHENKFVVGVNDIGNKYKFNSCEVFDSEVEMKQTWVLD